MNNTLQKQCIIKNAKTKHHTLNKINLFFYSN